MIRYALHCADGHRFDSWFPDSASFDSQAASGLVTCPRCDSPHVVKAIMAPAVVATQREAKAPGPPLEAAAPAGTALFDAGKRLALRELRRTVLAQTRDVGTTFAVEARRIHEIESGERIRGQATLSEARELLEDGVMILPMPVLPDELD